MFENIRLAFQGIWSHKMRSFLTMLGIIIGIASIIAIVSTIKGTSEQIKDNLIGSGNNTVNVTLSQGDSAYSVDYYDGSSSGSTPILSQSLKDEVLKTDHVENATFFYSRTDYNSSVYYENSSFSGGKVYGIDTNYLNTCGYQVRSGRGFVQADYDNFRKVALVDSYAADTMFPGANPVGKIIEIGSEPYTVVGVVRQSADSLPNMDTPSDFNSYYENVIGTVMIPNKCWPISYKFDEPENAIVKVDSTDNMSETGSAVAKILNKSISSTGSGSSGFKYKADDELALGEMEVTGSAHTGKEVKLWKIVYENGKQVSKDVINESTYSKADKTISVGIKTKNSSAAAVVKEAVSTQDKVKIQAAISEASSMESSSEQ